MAHFTMAATVCLLFLTFLVAENASEFICPIPDHSPANLHPDPANCSCYYQCEDTIAYHMPCPAGLHFSPTILVCTWPADAGCVLATTTTTPTTTASTTTASTTTTTTTTSYTTTSLGSTTSGGNDNNNEDDLCEHDPCLHCGACTKTTTPPYFSCNCTSGYTGTHCQLGTCDEKTCINGVCAQGDQDLGEGDICLCNAGYSGAQCTDHVCANEDCNNNGTCVVDDIGAPICLCNAGFTGDHCETRLQPNYIIIVIDDLGSNDVGWHKYAPSDIHTENMEALVDEYGVYLLNNNVQPMCTPSRHALLFGRHEVQDSLQHYVIRSGQRNASPASLTSLPEKLRDLNYRSYLIGKYHLGNFNEDVMPTGQGFDEFLGYLHGESNHYTRIGREPVPCFYNEVFQNLMFEGYDFFNGTEPWPTPEDKYSTDLFADYFVDVLTEHMTYYAEQPFFIDVSFNAVHAPLQVPGGIENPTSSAEYRQNYAGMVEYLDRAIYNMTQFLMEYDNGRVWENTIIVMTSDNGGDPSTSKAASNYPLRGGKFTLFEGGLKGAGFVVSPYLKKLGLNGTKNSEFLHISDWYPTFVHLAGGTIDSEDKLSGHIVWQDVNSPIVSPRTEMLLTIDSLTPCKGVDNGYGIFDTRQRAGVRMNNWKLLTGDPVTSDGLEAYNWQNGGHEPQEGQAFDEFHNVYLFDLNEDPNEEEDVSAENENIVKHMLGLLAEYKRTLVSPVLYPPMDRLADPKRGLIPNPNEEADEDSYSFYPWADPADAPPTPEYCFPQVPPPAVCSNCGPSVGF